MQGQETWEKISKYENKTEDAFEELMGGGVDMPNKGFETFQEIKALCESVKENGDLFYDKGNQAAGTRARVSLDKLARLKVQWRKETK
jgi:hypothetical protein